MRKLVLSTVLVCAAALVAGCGSSDDDPIVSAVAATDVEPPVGASVAAAIVQVPFSFPQGVPDLGTTASTTVAFTNTATSPAFSIASGSSTATGTTNFGSCIFTVQSSTFPTGHRLAAGQTITVNPCNLRVNTTGIPANDVAVTRSAALRLGAALSAGSTVTMQVNAGGQLTLNGRSVGQVTLVAVSG